MVRRPSTPVHFDRNYAREVFQHADKRTRRAITNQFPPHLVENENRWLNVERRRYVSNLRSLSNNRHDDGAFNEAIAAHFQRFSTRLMLAVCALHKKQPRAAIDPAASMHDLRRLALSISTSDAAIPTTRTLIDDGCKSRWTSAYSKADYARQLGVADVIGCAGTSPYNDFCAIGGGGRSALIEHLESLISSGYRHFYTADIRNAFGSVRPSHVRALIRLPDWAMDNILFPPDDMDTADYTDTDYDLTPAKALRGLPQGSVCSSAALSMVVGNVLRSLAGDRWEVSVYADNIYAAARSRSALVQFQARLEEGLTCGGRGGLSLHDECFVDVRAGEPVTALGYSISRSSDGRVAAVPTSKAMNEAKARCFDKLAGCYGRRISTADEAQAFITASKYFQGWVASQSRWLPGDPLVRSAAAEYAALDVVQVMMRPNSLPPAGLPRRARN